MTFVLIARIILLIAGLLFGVASIGANDQKNGERCVCLATMFITAMAALTFFEMTYGR